MTLARVTLQQDSTARCGAAHTPVVEYQIIMGSLRRNKPRLSCPVARKRSFVGNLPLQPKTAFQLFPLVRRADPEGR